MDPRRVLDRLKDALDAVLDRKDETGGQLLEFPSGVHQRRRVRQEVKRRHKLEEPHLPASRRILVVRRVNRLRLCDVVSNARKKLLGCLEGLPAVVPRQIPAFEHQACILGELRREWTAFGGCHTPQLYQRYFVDKAINVTSSVLTTGLILLLFN